MRPIFRWLVPFLIASPCLTAALRAKPTATAPADQAQFIKELADQFRDRLGKSRYMESGQAQDINLPDWRGFPIKRYTYSVHDKDGTTKTADVVMLNPSADQIALWI